MAKKSLLTFDRWDFLGTRLILSVIAVAVAATSLVSPLVSWLAGDPLTRTLPGGEPDGAIATGLTAKDGVSLTWSNQVTASVPDAGAGTWLASLLPGLITTILVVVVVVTLLRLLSRIERGDDFARAGLRALRIVGACLILGAITVGLADGLASAVVTDAAVASFAGDSVSFTIDSSVPVIAAAIGLVCGALAEAFGHLADDVEGLV